MSATRENYFAFWFGRYRHLFSYPWQHPQPNNCEVEDLPLKPPCFLSWIASAQTKQIPSAQWRWDLGFTRSCWPLPWWWPSRTQSMRQVARQAAKKTKEIQLQNSSMSKAWTSHLGHKKPVGCESRKPTLFEPAGEETISLLLRVCLMWYFFLWAQVMSK